MFLLIVSQMPNKPTFTEVSHAHISQPMEQPTAYKDSYPGLALLGAS